MRRQDWAVGLLIGLVLACAQVRGAAAPSPVQAQSACPAPQPPAAEDGGELSGDAKRQAFTEVIGQSGQYGDYHFPLAGEALLPAVPLRVLAQAMAGIESDWHQYSAATGTTLQGNDTPCDYGLLQINAVSWPDLFTRSPSLLSSTRGNIAAGMVALTQQWNNGVTSTLPVVNVGQPQWLLNWYYALSAYNGGPRRPDGQYPKGLWANNPICNGGFAFCQEYDFRNSRPWDTDINRIDAEVTWSDRAVEPGFFPYQERVLYNLQHPKRPEGSAWWTAGDLGVQATTSRGNTGIRPDDRLFLSADQASRAPNLLLFRHSATPLNTTLDAQRLGLSYDLPLPARVTIELLDSAVNGRVLATLLRDAARPAGWSSATLAVPGGLPTTAAYRIRAVAGSPGSTSSAEGQYVQLLARRLFLPLLNVPPALRDPVRNGLFRTSDPASGLPADWAIQAVYGPTTVLTDQLKLVESAEAGQHLRIAAEPGAQLLLGQRFQATGRYRLRVTYTLVQPVPQLGTGLRVRLVERSTGQALVDATYGVSDWTFNLTPVELAGTYDLSLTLTFSADDRTSWLGLSNVLLEPVPGGGDCLRPAGGPAVPC